MIGNKLGHYQITAHLGSGGMGEVYQAIDAKLGRSVAIKILPDAFARDADRLARFEREARVLALLNHPNIAGIYGIEQSDNQNFRAVMLSALDVMPSALWPRRTDPRARRAKALDSTSAGCQARTAANVQGDGIDGSESADWVDSANVQS
jgi:serine/threonine protein kinase